MVITMNPSSLTATALAAAAIAAASVLAFSYLPSLFVWAAFIGWASYDHSGATLRAGLRSSCALVFGVLMAWTVAVAATSKVLPLPPSLATALCAGVASFLIVLASATPLLSVVPATFYGFASTFACLSLSPGAFRLEALIAFSWRNVLIGLPLSLLAGTGLGMLHGWSSKALGQWNHAGKRPAPVLMKRVG
jgi:uncharacterized protein DUF1097